MVGVVPAYTPIWGKTSHLARDMAWVSVRDKEDGKTRGRYKPIKVNY